MENFFSGFAHMSFYLYYLCGVIRRVFTILLLTIMLLQVAGKWIILADYALNKEFIARTLCVNKAKPVLQCKGKCHLRKQLQKEETGGTQEQNKSYSFQEVFCDHATSYRIPKITQVAVTIPITNTVLYTSPYAGSIFHPPSA
jgi:hypothetical protein